MYSISVSVYCDRTTWRMECGQQSERNITLLLRQLLSCYVFWRSQIKYLRGDLPLLRFLLNSCKQMLVIVVS